jgi:hypothetical protein
MHPNRCQQCPLYKRSQLRPTIEVSVTPHGLLRSDRFYEVNKFIPRELYTSPEVTTDRS